MVLVIAHMIVVVLAAGATHAWMRALAAEERLAELASVRKAAPALSRAG